MTGGAFGDRSQQILDELHREGYTPAEVKEILREALQRKELSRDEHPCPECDEEMTIDEMLKHRLSKHGLSVLEQLEDVPETLGDLDDKNGGVR